MLIFTKLKGFLNGWFTAKKRDSKQQAQEESFSYLNENTEKFNFYKLNGNAKGYLTNNLATLSILPVIYLLSSLLIIIILLW